MRHYACYLVTLVEASSEGCVVRWDKWQEGSGAKGTTEPWRGGRGLALAQRLDHGQHVLLSDEDCEAR